MIIMSIRDPRYANQGDASGEDFYIKVLNDAFFNSIKNNLNFRNKS